MEYIKRNKIILFIILFVVELVLYCFRCQQIQQISDILDENVNAGHGNIQDENINAVRFVKRKLDFSRNSKAKVSLWLAKTKNISLSGAAHSDTAMAQCSSKDPQIAHRPDAQHDLTTFTDKPVTPLTRYGPHLLASPNLPLTHQKLNWTHNSCLHLTAS